MKSISFFIFFLWFSRQIIAQQHGEKRISIELNERVQFYSVDQTYTPIKDIIYHSPVNFRIYPNYDTITYKGELYLIFQYPPYTKNAVQPTQRTFYTLNEAKTINKIDNATNKAIHVDILDNNEVRKPEEKCINNLRLAIRKKDFDVVKKTDYYDTSIKKTFPTFGIMSVPFKIRPNIDSVGWNLTTDVTLGPYIGATWRISRRKKWYLTIPFTFGLSFINLEDNTTSNTRTENVTDVVPGLTGASGVIVQFEDFTFGGVVGVDFAPGYESRFVYSAHTWFSIAIGYNFLTRNDKDKD